MTSPPGVDATLTAVVDEFFSSHAPAARDALEHGHSPLPLWQQAEQLGLTRVGIAEDAGGSGGSLEEFLAVLMSAARHAVPLPLAENHLASWLLAAAGIGVPAGLLTVDCRGDSHALELRGGTAAGCLRGVPWAEAATQIVAVVQDETKDTRVVALNPRQCTMRPGEDLAGEPTATVEVSQQPLALAVLGSEADDYLLLGALCRTAQIAGALQALADITLRYVGQRIQFGKPVGAFQAVQAHVVSVAQAAEITTMATWGAARAWQRRADCRSFEVMSAKLIANESAQAGVRAAHQAHGAVGMTREYVLHHYTRRLNLWRHQFGTERALAASLGMAVHAAPSFARVLSDTDNGITVPWPR